MSVNDRMTAMSAEDLDAWEKVFGLKKEDWEPEKAQVIKKSDSDNEICSNKS